ncbi:hypothetical protein XENTR_v10014398 [Xenopus tropicalis]|uniref:Organic solute transporter subunit alpha n=1 Tax=Xenopus tropicalis TaxID=8364 RepID=F7DAX2_XENTR|nr:organic solute transporter subunit alpha [Xenopus tropicalis]KAE8603634.1 hypothetical protein XENTR_v10014398 [Xenopus tropicalis]|eukprot:XP_002934092.1 PREDICTED: organic solute transporter subunit alpha [Xenopus tropicalis]
MASMEEFHPDPRIPRQLVDFLIANYSVPKACFSKPPAASQLPQQLDTLHLCTFGILTILVIISLILYLEEAFYLRKKVLCPVKRKTLLWSSASPTIIAIFSCFGLWIPRASMFVDIAIGTYFAICFYLILTVIIEGFGGKDTLVKKMENTDVNINTGPCCCCCPCLPRIKLTKRKVTIFTLGVIQMAFLKPIFSFIGLFLWADGIFNPDDISAQSLALWMGTIIGVSTIIALWPIGILFRQAKIHLNDQNIGAKFAVFQILLILTTLQASIFSILAGAGQIPCFPPYSSKARSQLMNNNLLIVETFLLSIVARNAYRIKDEEAGFSFKSQRM